MTRLAFVVPGLIGRPEDDPLVALSSPAFEALSRSGVVRKVEPLGSPVTPEWAYLGQDPSRYPVEGGPLLISAMRVDPPERSVHFQMSLLAVEDGRVRIEPEPPSAAEARVIAAQVERLAGGGLTPLWWHGLDHGLVWESGSLDLAVTSPEDASGAEVAKVLPEGDGESLLRRFIDDSVNLLSELELNRIRIEEGKTPLNLLWPWGFGFRPSVPNLALRRGEIRRIESTSWRTQGLARLAGEYHGDRNGLVKGVHPDWSAWRERLTEGGSTVMIVDELAEMRRAGRLDELEYTVGAWAAAFLDDLAIEQDRAPRRISIIAPGPDGNPGLSLSIDPAQGLASGSIPFDERAFDDRRMANWRIWEAVEAGLTP